MKTASLHEDLEREIEVRGSSDRSFGLVMAAFLLLVGLWPVVRGGALRPWSLAAAVVLGAIALARPSVLGPLNRAWTRLGLLLQQIVSPVVLGLLFFAALTPVALLMRLLGKTPLSLDFDRGARSYWIDRRPPGPAPDSMRQQF
jgi:hypothetical protein